MVVERLAHRPPCRWLCVHPLMCAVLLRKSYGKVKAAGQFERKQRTQRLQQRQKGPQESQRQEQCGVRVEQRKNRFLHGCWEMAVGSNHQQRLR